MVCDPIDAERGMGTTLVGIVSPPRAIDWGTAGLPATLPGGETTPNPWTPPTRTTVCATIAPEGTALLNRRAHGSQQRYSGMQTGTGRPAASGKLLFQRRDRSLFLHDHVSLRASLGHGPGGRCRSDEGLLLRGRGIRDRRQTYILNHFSLAAAPGPGKPTTVELSAAESAITPGTLIGITQCCTTGASGSISSAGGLSCSAANGLASMTTAASSIAAGTGRFAPTASDLPSPRPPTPRRSQARVQVVALTAVSGTTLTVSPPIFLDDLSTANTLALWDIDPTDTALGLEDLSLDLTGSSAATDSQFHGCYGVLGQGHTPHRWRQ